MVYGSGSVCSGVNLNQGEKQRLELSGKVERVEGYGQMLIASVAMLLSVDDHWAPACVYIETHTTTMLFAGELLGCVPIQGQHPSKTHPSPPAKAGSFRETCRSISWLRHQMTRRVKFDCQKCLSYRNSWFPFNPPACGGRGEAALVCLGLRGPWRGKPVCKSRIQGYLVYSC